MKQNHHYTFETKAVLYSGLLTFALLCILFAVGGLAPFGSKSLAVMDADIQYLDFFSYFKDVLSGKNTIGYTFGKTLGGSNIAVFSYYLSSPFNLLLFFFSNQQLHTFFDLVVALKLTLASVAFAYFSVHRFNRSSDENLCLYVLISTAYGLCQYNFAQASKYYVARRRLYAAFYPASGLLYRPRQKVLDAFLFSRNRHSFQLVFCRNRLPLQRLLVFV